MKKLTILLALFPALAIAALSGSFGGAGAASEAVMESAMDAQTQAKRNALSNELIVALASACRDAALDPDVRCLIISGGDTFFRPEPISRKCSNAASKRSTMPFVDRPGMTSPNSPSL
jgi:hypothetical protein